MSNLWTTVADLGDYSDSDYAYDSVKTASYILWALSGRKFSGFTTVTERYVSTFDPYFRYGMASNQYQPVLIDGDVVNIPSTGMSCMDLVGDGTSSTTRVRLRGRKVTKIHLVRDLAGNIVHPSEYYLGDHSTMYASPNASWNSSIVEVTYTYGNPPPIAGQSAAKLLAIELVKMYEGDDTCSLPQRVTSVTRQGVSYTILDDQTFIDELKTGIYSIDLFLKAANPDKARARARVFSPDVPRARRITGRDPLYPLAAQDLIISGGTGGSVTILLDAISADFLLLDPAWALSATLSSLDGASADLLNDPTLSTVTVGSESITVLLGYSEALALLGPRDAGILDIFATRPSIGNPLVDEVVVLSTSNVIYHLGQPAVVTP